METAPGHGPGMLGLHPDLTKEGDGALRVLTILSAVFATLSVVAHVWTSDWTTAIPRDGSTLVIGRDFLNFWMYGRAAVSAEPGLFYDPQIYNAELRALLGGAYPGQNWSYPPNVMLFAAPFGQLSYLLALAAWTALGIGILLAVARHALNDRRFLFALLLSPAAFFGLISGQSALVITAAMIGIFAWLDRKPVAAGVLIGLLTLKPQVGMFLPILLIASGRWRVFMSAALTTLVIAALVAALFGPQLWIDYLTKGIAVQNQVLVDARLIAAPFMPTIFMNMRSAGAGYDLAMAVQLCFTVIAVATVFWAYRFRRDADPMLLMALFLACSVFGSPYLLAYDALPLTFTAVLLLASGRLDAVGQRLALLAYWLPALQMAFGTFNIPGPALIAPALAFYLVAILKGGEAWLSRAQPVAANR